MCTTVPFASDLGFWRRKCNFNQKQWRQGWGGWGGLSQVLHRGLRPISISSLLTFPPLQPKGRKTVGRQRQKPGSEFPEEPLRGSWERAESHKASGNALFPWTISQHSSLSEAVYLDTLLPLYCSFNIHLSKGKMLMCIIRISIVYE